MRAPKLFVVAVVLSTVAFYGQLAFSDWRPGPGCNYPQDFSDPPGYTNPRLDGFFRKARRVVGDRWSHEEQGCVRGARLDARFGVADLTLSEKRRIEGLAPPWLRIDVFETEYSNKELSAFCDRAMKAVDAYADIWAYCTQSEGKLGIGVTTRETEVPEVLDGVIPSDAYFVEVGSRASF